MSITIDMLAITRDMEVSTIGSREGTSARTKRGSTAGLSTALTITLSGISTFISMTITPVRGTTTTVGVVTSP